jgi:hypothetical protein
MYTRQHGLESNLFLAPGEEAVAATEPATDTDSAERSPAALAILRGGRE